MPNIPNVSTLNTNTAGILNTIRDNASDAYREAVPTAKQTTESIRAVGEAINGYEARRNEFLNALVNIMPSWTIFIRLIDTSFNEVIPTEYLFTP